MYEYERMPEKYPIAFIRHVFISKKLVRLFFFILLLLVGIGLMFSSSPKNIHANDSAQFNAGYQNAVNSGWNTGHWGTAPWYIDNDNNMYVGHGQLNGTLHNVLDNNGSTESNNVKTVNFTEPVKAPQNSSFLLSTSGLGILGGTQLQAINGTEKIDTSQATDMNNIFSNDSALHSLDLSSWNVDNVKNLAFAFWNNASLTSLNLSGWNTSNATSMSDAFDVTNKLYNIILGNQTYLRSGQTSGFSNSKHFGTTFQNESNQHVSARQLEDGNAHPGNWHEDQFSHNASNADKNNWQRGMWGNAPWYVDNNNNMHVGSGQLLDQLSNVVGFPISQSLHSINLDEPVKAPYNSSCLLAASPGSNNNQLTAINGLSNLDTSQVNWTIGMFSSDYDVAHLDGMSNWDTSHATNMYEMFYGTNALQNLDISHWNVSNNTDMQTMFWYDQSLKNLNLSNWHPNALNNIQDAFTGDTNLRDLNIGNLDLSHANRNDLLGGTSGAADDWLRKITLNNSTILNSASHLPNVEWQNGNQILNNDELADGTSHPGTWTVDNFARNMIDSMASGQCKASGRWGDASWYIDNNNNMYVGHGQLRGHLYNVIGYNNTHSIRSLNFTESVKAPRDSSWLLAASSGIGDNNFTLQAINGTEKIDTSQATTMGDMFSNDFKVKNLNLSNWNTSNVTDMNSIFDADQSLSNLNVADWDVHNVTNFSYAFYLTSLKNLNLSGWHTSSANDLASVFENNSQLKSINMKNFDTRNANVNSMFIMSPGINQLVLGNNVQFKNLDYLPGFEWRNGNSLLQTIQLQNSDSHPGTWNRTQFDEHFWRSNPRGKWGSALWYVDNNNNMHVGTGQLQGTLSNAVGFSTSKSLHSINFDEPVKAPQNSSSLLGASPGSNDNQLTAINGLSNIDTSQVTDMSTMFSSDFNVAHLDGMNDWDTSNVKDMHGMFYGTNALQNLDISHWNTSNANNMQTMFWYNRALSNLNLTGWNTSNVNNMEYMFYGDISLQNLNISSFNTNNTNNMYEMYDNDDALDSITFGNETKNTPLAYTALPNNDWHNGNQVLNSSTLQDNNAHPGTWTVDQFTHDYHQAKKNGERTGQWGTALWYIDNDNNMYVGGGQLHGNLKNTVPNDSNNLKSINFERPVQAPQDSSFLLSGTDTMFKYNYSIQAINGLDNMNVSQVSNMNGMFANDFKITKLDHINNWNTSNVQKLSNTFNGLPSLQNLDINNWDVHNVNSMFYTFYNDHILKNLNLSNWHPNNLNTIEHAFGDDSNLHYLNISNLDTSHAYKNYMFGGSFDAADDWLRKITLGNNTTLNGVTYFPNVEWQNGNQKLSDKVLTDGNAHPGTWNVDNFAQNMINCINSGNCKSSGRWGTAPWYIDNNNNMHVGHGQLLGTMYDAIGGISNAQKLNSVNIDESVKAPTNSQRLFAILIGNLSSINGLSNVDTSQATNMSEIFLGDNNLTSIPGISNWNTSNATEMQGTFNNDYALKSLDISNWHTPNLKNNVFEFWNDHSLQSLKMNHMNTTNTSSMNDMFDANFALRNLELGSNTYLKGGSNIGLPAYPFITEWQSDNQIINTDNLTDGTSHAGNWNMDQFSNNMINAYHSNQMKSHGRWGTAPWYIDNDNNMYVGHGQLNGSLHDILDNNGSTESNNVRTVNFIEPVKAPQNSSWLLSTSAPNIMGITNLQAINGTEKIDTSQATTMDHIFNNDADLKKLDLSSWNVDNVKNLAFAFWDNIRLNNLNLSTWNTSNVTDMSDTFDVTNKLYNIILGNQTYIKSGKVSGFGNSKHFGTTFQNENNQHVSARQLEDGNAHPGNWHEDQFSHNASNADKNNWQRGMWGTAPWYIDPNDESMHIGAGNLNGDLANTIGNGNASAIKSINFDENAKAPQNSSFLLSTSNLGIVNSSNLTNINGLNRLDTSAATNMDDMFSSDNNLNHLNLDSWDVSHVQSLGFAFYNCFQLTDLNVNNWNTSNVNNLFSTFSGANQIANLNLSNWNTKNVNNMSCVFYNDSSLRDLVLSDWSSASVKTMNQLFGNDNLAILTLGNNLKLANNAGLNNTSWQNNDDIATSSQLQDNNAHPGTWNNINVQKNSDITGTNHDDLTNLIERKCNLPQNSGRVYVSNEGKYETNNHLKLNDDQQRTLGHTHYDNLYYGVKDNNNQVTYYRSGLNVYDYSKGNDLQGNNNQSLQELVNNHYGTNVVIDDDGNSTNNGLMQTGTYQIAYHYKDASNNPHYVVSNLRVFDNTNNSNPYLIINDHPSDELNNHTDIQHQLTQFYGTNSDANLNLFNVTDSTANYKLSDGNRNYSGSIKIIPSMSASDNITNPPATNDPTWQGIVMKHFDHLNGITLSKVTIDSAHMDKNTGEINLQGKTYLSDGQFINNPAIPYKLYISQNNSTYTVDNTVNDQQVQDIINSIDKDAKVIRITDGDGNNITNAFGNLAMMPNNSNVSIQLRTKQGYVSIHFNNISNLAEPDVDISHNLATEGSDISNNELKNKISNAAHENVSNGFTIDTSQKVSSDVREIDYHFAKNVNAHGQGINVNTNNVTVSGTVYVHYNNDNTGVRPTYTIVQGDNAVQHIENVTGHKVKVTKAPDNQNLANLPVGSYDLAYQNTDMGDDSNTTYNATVDVIPDYYFSPTQNNDNYDNGESGDFKSYDYQNNGNHYKSVIDTNDYDNNDHPGHHNNDDTTDGLHTTDNKPAHFDGKAPWGNK